MAGCGLAELVGGTGLEVGVAIKVSVLEAGLMRLWSVELPLILAPIQHHKINGNIPHGDTVSRHTAIMIRTPGIQVAPIRLKSRNGAERVRWDNSHCCLDWLKTSCDSEEAEKSCGWYHFLETLYK